MLVGAAMTMMNKPQEDNSDLCGIQTSGLSKLLPNLASKTLAETLMELDNCWGWLRIKKGTAPLTNFVTVHVFFSQNLQTHWWQVRYVSYIEYSKEPNNCNSSGYRFMDQNMEDIDFHTFLL